MSRLTRTIIIGSLLFIALVSVTTLHFKSQSQVQVPPGLRAQRDTWTPLMDVLKEKGRPRVTDGQLAKMKALPIEAMWGAVQSSGKYRTRDIYPRPSPEVEKVFEEWKKTHPKKP